MILNRHGSRPLDALAIALLLIVAVAMIPLGGNRPFVWGATGLLLGMVIVAYALVAWWRGSPMPEWRWEAWVFLAFLGLAVLQVVPGLSPAGDGSSISLAPADSLLSLLTWGQYGLLFAFGALAATGRRRSGWMLETLFWIAAAQAAIGLVSLFALGDTLLGATKPQYEGFATGTFVNRNSFATYVAAAIPMGIALLAGAGDAGDPVRRRWLAAARIAGLLLLVAALIASGSRMGLAAGIAGAGLAVALVLVGGRGRSAIVLAVAICALLVATGFGAPLLQRIVEPSDDLANRLTLYSQVWDAILARPLFGYGGGSFATVFPMFQHAPLPGDLVWQRAHSTYLALWFEYGLVAGSIPMIVVAGLWLQCLRWLLRRPGNTTMLAVVTAVPVFALHSAVDFSLEIHAVALFFALLLGIGAGVARLGRP